jgi:hypothetical protein
MSTVTIPRTNVTVEEVSTVLRNELGSHYQVTPFAASHVHHESSADANSILVRRNWLIQANVRLVAGTDQTEIHVGSAANFTPTGLLLNGTTIVRKVHRVLEHSTELAGS